MSTGLLEEENGNAISAAVRTFSVSIERCGRKVFGEVSD